MSFNSHDCETVSMKEAQEQEKNNPVTQIAAATSIAFVVLAEGGQIDDVTATENVEQFAPWAYPIAYKKGNIRRYGSDLYRCNQDHTSQADWTPDVAVSLFAQVLIPDPEVIPEWVQPESTNPYMTGDKVTYNGKTYVSTIDNNVWAPDAYGWEEI